MVIEIETLKQFQDIINIENTLIVIDFYAIWCGPCMKFHPVYESLATTYPDVQFYKINFDNKDLSDIYDACVVTQLPTFCFFKNGNYIKKQIGANIVTMNKLITTLA